MCLWDQQCGQFALGYFQCQKEIVGKRCVINGKEVEYKMVQLELCLDTMQESKILLSIADQKTKV